MPPPDPELLDDVRGLVRAALGQRTVVTGVEPLQVGDDAAVLLVTVAGGRRLVVKVAGAGADARVAFERTAELTALARAAGAPVPEILAADDSRRSGRWRHLVAEHVEGTPWRDVRPLLTADEVVDAHRQIALALVTVQSARFPAFGELGPGGRPPPGQDLLAALLRRAHLRIRGGPARSAFLEVLDREAAAFAVAQPATLTHDDLHHGNVLFRRDRDGWRLAGLLDWDKAWAGPAESDVARMAFWDDMTGPGFWEVYRAHVPADPGAARRALVHQLLWCLEYDDGSPRHAADTTRVRERLAVP